MVSQLTILGPGLLGGSVGLAARQRKLAQRVVVWARRPEAVDEAVRCGAADAGTTDLREAVRGASAVVFATPVGVMESLADQIREDVAPECFVTDVGSVKYPVVRTLSARFGRFIGAHPMAGSEQTGLSAARVDLFERAVCILTPVECTEPVALQWGHDFWKALGCVVRTMPPTVHDEVVARVSHLPHVVAAAVVNVVAGGDGEALQFAGPGFRDFSRIASGPPEMWTEICMENRDELRRALGKLMEELDRWRVALDNRDVVELRALLRKAKRYRDEWRMRSEG
ncbi:MAG: prephenate dehydrogenase/arogenate dehydrogenase family protein [Verrucomicrobiae bacterium]|nr:prephenate dehydrogenase/arogenate dehydrogenase family protein [Verrucomicrobiae bacterium]